MDDARPVSEPLPRVLDAALGLFAEQGYHGTSIRDIARAAGLSVPGVYHHYPAKHDVLDALMTSVMTDLLGRMRAAQGAAGEDPVARFDALVETLLWFHLERRREAFVASSELRSLEPRQRAVVVGMRDDAQAMVLDAVLAARADGSFATEYPEEAARSVAVLCIGLATWYRDDGKAAAADVVRVQLALARALVGANRPAGVDPAAPGMAH